MSYLVEKQWIVYKYTNLKNGLIYIGITSKTLEERWKAGYPANKKLYRTIKKYGEDIFKKEILFSGLTKEEACQKEIELIAQYDATNPKIGYNIALGGTAPMYGRHHSKASKEKFSQRVGSLNPFYGKHHDREKIKDTVPIICLNDLRHFHSISLAESYYKEKGCSGCSAKNIQRAIGENIQLSAGKDLNKNPMFWEVYDKNKTKQEWYKILEDKQKKYWQINRNNNKKSKPVINLSTNTIYYSAKEAASKTNQCETVIYRCCIGTRKVVYNQIYCYLEDYMIMSEEERKQYKINRQVDTKGSAVYCLNTGKFYQNQIVAAQDYEGVTKDMVHDAANGKTEYGGISKNGEFLRWMKYEDYITMSKEDIDKILKTPVKRHRPVICTTTGKRFRDAQSGATFYGLFRTGVQKCCQGIYKHCGEYQGIQLQWEYEDEYHWDEYDEQEDEE